MRKPTYYELLRHPSWKAKRAVIVARANGKCEQCGDGDAPLNVHHRYYQRGHSPWEYPDSALRCLCEACHLQWHCVLDNTRERIGQLSLDQLFQLRELLNAFERGDQPEEGPVVPLTYVRAYTRFAARHTVPA